jgi:hypothetical protein
LCRRHVGSACVSLHELETNLRGHNLALQRGTSNNSPARHTKSHYLLFRQGCGVFSLTLGPPDWGVAARGVQFTRALASAAVGLVDMCAARFAVPGKEKDNL